MKDTHAVIVDHIVRHGGKSTIFFHLEVLYKDEREFLEHILAGTREDLAKHNEAKKMMIRNGTFDAAAESKW